MRFSIVIRPRAEQDMASIWSFIAKDNIAAADRLIRHFQEVFALLGEQPYSGRERDDLMTGPRSFAVENYIAFYLPNADSVDIIRVLHSARDIPRQFN